MLHSTTEMRFYRMEVTRESRGLAHCANANTNNWEHLESYNESVGWVPRRDFLMEAKCRIAAGEQVYTVTKDGMLVHYGWVVAPAHLRYVSEIDILIELPPQAAYAYDFFTHPRFRNTGLYQQSLRKIASDLARYRDIHELFIGVDSTNVSSMTAVEKVGFTHSCTLRECRSWGSPRHWYVNQYDVVSVAQLHQKTVDLNQRKLKAGEYCYRFAVTKVN
jgi:RimJ/RimL family protein N-acetyltransferase